MNLSAYLKPTNFCTVDCDHCYLPPEVRADKSSMSDETIRKTARFLLNLSKKESHRTIHIIWHGGEVMMLKPEWYENAISILDEIIGKDRYTQSIQTSLIPYTSKWKHLLESRFHSFIGSSIDFTQRTIRNSTTGYLKKWLEKVELARKDGMYIVPGMVPTRFEIGKGKDIVDWFVNNEFKEFNIERYTNFGNDFTSIDFPSNHHHSRFITEVFDAIFERKKNGEKAPYVKLVAAAIKGIIYNLPGDRWGGSCQREFIVIEPDGSLNSCPDRALNEKPFSNIADEASRYISSKERRNWIRVQEITHKKSYCDTCEYQSWCKSGCPIVPNGIDEGEKECSGYKTFLDHVKLFLSDDRNLKLAIEYVKPLGETITQDKEL